MAQAQLVDNVTLELRRGVIVLAVLSQLQEEQYDIRSCGCFLTRGWTLTRGRFTRCCGGWKRRGF